MFIYILNLLNDGLKNKNNINECSAFEIINDTKYISELAGIEKNFDFKNISYKLMNIFEVLNKYNLTVKDSMGIFNKLISNNNNSWLFEYFYKGNINNEIDVMELTLNSIMNNALKKDKKEREVCEKKLLEEIRVVGYEITSEVRITEDRYRGSCF